MKGPADFDQMAALMAARHEEKSAVGLAYGVAMRRLMLIARLCSPSPHELVTSVNKLLPDRGDANWQRKCECTCAIARFIRMKSMLSSNIYGRMMRLAYEMLNNFTKNLFAIFALHGGTHRLLAYIIMKTLSRPVRVMMSPFRDQCRDRACASKHNAAPATT